MTEASVASSPSPEPAASQSVPESAPLDWREALLNLLSARAALVDLEARELARATAAKLMQAALALLALAVTWLLILAGAIGALAAFTPLAWYWIALILALLHAIAATILGKAASQPSPPAFPHSRSEFLKDREWIRNLFTNRKSKG